MTKVKSEYLRKLAKGTCVFKQGDRGCTMYIIHSGTVRITRDIAGQKEDLGLLEKGDFFGEMSVLEDVPRTASACAETDAELIEIDKEGFIRLLKSNAEIPIRMIRKYALKLEEMNKKFEYLLENKREYDKGIREIISQIKGTHEISNPKQKDENAIAYLSHASSDKSFKIKGESTLVGRVDPVTNIIPDIDLTALDSGRTVSRRHARLTYMNDAFYVIEEIGVTNGTFVNGARLSTGDLKQLSDGDRVSFGKVELVLHKIR